MRGDALAPAGGVGVFAANVLERARHSQDTGVVAGLVARPFVQGAHRVRRCAHALERIRKALSLGNILEERANQVAARAEVEVDGAAGDAGALGDRGHVQEGKTVLLEERTRGSQQRCSSASAAGVGRPLQGLRRQGLHSSTHSVYFLHNYTYCVVSESRRSSMTTLVRVLGIVAGLLAAEAVWLVAEGALAIHVQAPAGTLAAEPVAIDPLTVALAAGVLPLIGWVALVGLEQFTRHARTIWLVLALVGLASSLAMPLSGTGVSDANRVVLVVTHLVVGAIVTTVLYRTSPRRATRSIAPSARAAAGHAA